MASLERELISLHASLGRNSPNQGARDPGGGETSEPDVVRAQKAVGNIAKIFIQDLLEKDEGTCNALL